MISFCWIDIEIDLQISWNSASYASGWAIQKFQVTLINSQSPQLLHPAPRAASVRPNNRTNREMWSTFFVASPRFVPKHCFHLFRFVPFVSFQLTKSGENTVTLRSVTHNITGKYQCEVSADAPLFHTETSTATMLVAELPEYKPIVSIYGMPNMDNRKMIAMGETFKAMCISGPSTPPVNFTWIINGITHPVIELPLCLSWVTPSMRGVQRFSGYHFFCSSIPSMGDWFRMAAFFLLPFLSLLESAEGCPTNDWTDRTEEEEKKTPEMDISEWMAQLITFLLTDHFDNILLFFFPFPFHVPFHSIIWLTVRYLSLRCSNHAGP